MNPRERLERIADGMAVGCLVASALAPLPLGALAACGQPVQRLADILIALCVIVATSVAWLSRGWRR